MSMQHFGKGALRVAKNYTKGYSDVQAKVRDATSNDPWGPSGTQMNDIAQMTYNQNDFVEIMEMLDKRLNDKGKNWRHVFKALTVLDYCLHAGSENTVIYFKDNLYVIKTLKEFQFVDEYGKDQGANVRQKAKDITNLLMDDARLREERRSRATMRDRMVRGGTGEFGEDDDPLENENERRRRAQQMLGPSRSNNPNKEDDEMRRAIEASKRSLADEQRRLGEERDLAKALALSEADEAARKRALQDGGALFDSQAENAAPATNGGGGDLLIDFNAAPQQQLQPQFTSFNPYTQQAQQQAMQEQYLRQQAEWEAMQQAQLQAQQQAQQEEWMRQQMMAQQQQQQAQQDEWNRQQLMLQQQQQQQQQQFLMAQQQQMHSPLMAQPTGYGSNNPFAMMGGQPQPQQQSSPAPAPMLSPMPSISDRPAASPSPSMNSLTQQNTLANARRTPANDGANSHLAQLIANREDGQDTFGNVGNLRFGHGGTAQRLHQHQTGAGGHNPFGQQQPQQSEQPFFTV